jgi:hypothetical protein
MARADYLLRAPHPKDTRRNMWIPRIPIYALITILCALFPAANASAGQYVFSVTGNQLELNERPVKILGLRCSNALISEAKTDELLANLDAFKSYGVNTVSVFLMGSRFGDIKGYRPDASLEPTYARRLGRIIEAADVRGMLVLVGCLYWSTSTAKSDLGRWQQADANKAIGNTIHWLKDHNYHNVFVDVDNEGMAHQATHWSISKMIDAAHKVDSTIMIAYNDRDPAPANADLYIHFSPKVSGRPWLDSEATPTNATGGYWSTYSKETNIRTAGKFHNFSRVGRYTPEMKSNQYDQTKDGYENYNGHMLASTWLQCGPDEGLNGPFMTPGGRSGITDVNAGIDHLHPDSGILWWLEYIKNRYGAWNPPPPLKPQARQ